MFYLFLSIFTFFNLFGEQAEPKEKVTTHSIEINGETIQYTATVASGNVGYISYIKDTKENRPITFAFNGGPGSSSVWLHIASLGPRRIVTPVEGQKNIAPYELTDNLDTLLDQTDLVFIDPVGTGFSESEEPCFSIRSDVESVGQFIRDYLTKSKRWNSPKYIAGESYGAMRAIGLSEYLQDEFGIYLNGIILISAAIDFQTIVFDEDNSLPYFLFLPSYATTAWHHGLIGSNQTLEEVAHEARRFAFERYAPWLLCPSCYEAETIYEGISKYTGISIDVVRKARGRISDSQFFKELLKEDQAMVGRFDSREIGRFDNPLHDPSFTRIHGLVTGAFHSYLHNDLEFQDSYTLFSKEANRQWNFHDYNEWGYPNITSALRSALNINPKMSVFVAMGYFDLATPFTSVEFTFDHLEQMERQIQMEYYQGGHMFYLDPKEQAKFKQDLIQFYQKN